MLGWAAGSTVVTEEKVEVEIHRTNDTPHIWTSTLNTTFGPIPPRDRASVFFQLTQAPRMCSRTGLALATRPH